MKSIIWAIIALISINTLGFAQVQDGVANLPLTNVVSNHGPEKGSFDQNLVNDTSIADALLRLAHQEENGRKPDKVMVQLMRAAASSLSGTSTYSITPGQIKEMRAVAKGMQGAGFNKDAALVGRAIAALEKPSPSATTVTTTSSPAVVVPPPVVVTQPAKKPVVKRIVDKAGVTLHSAK